MTPTKQKPGIIYMEVAGLLVYRITLALAYHYLHCESSIPIR
jgi:hypothetical protein